jgi:hypothetical protein
MGAGQNPSRLKNSRNEKISSKIVSVFRRLLPKGFLFQEIGYFWADS